MRYVPMASVMTDRKSWPSRYRSTIQPSNRRSLPPTALSKSASCQTRPLSTPKPGTPPTSIETLALAVCGGVFQVTVPVFVTVVPIAAVAAIVARKRSVTDALGWSGPYTAE